ncbi:MAG: hypothetical protein WDO73_05545 [Ignavibacteriota bacterium]
MPKKVLKVKSAAAINGAAQPAPVAQTPSVDLKDSSLYLNRELSLLAFQRRVLDEADDESNPLLERVKFLAILGSNLDEFFMVRVAGLAAQMDAGSVEAGPDGMSPRAQLVAIRREYKRLLNDAHRCWEKAAAQARRGRHFHPRLCRPHRRATSRHHPLLRGDCFPGTYPSCPGPRQPFPHISNLSLNLAVLIRDHSGEKNSRA